jgi:quinol monooxygenase YgiN
LSARREEVAVIIVAGWIKVDPKDRDAFLDSRREPVLARRLEKGCIDYFFTADPIELGTVRVFERWESRGALDAHVALDRADPTRLSPYVLGWELHTYAVSDSTSVS